jgi:hypothetical protein
MAVVTPARSGVKEVYVAGSWKKEKVYRHWP